MDFLVGTFYTSKIFRLRFTETPSPSLDIVNTSEACGGHSWLALSKDHKYLYTTVWASPPAVASYRINQHDQTLTFLNSKPVKAMSGYVAVSETHLYSAGGPTGEIFVLNNDGSLGDCVQEMSFREAEGTKDGHRGDVAHGNFGGLRHGAHSVDISPDGQSLYIADIGHNCVWSYSIVDSTKDKGKVELGMKWIATRSNDGPRHTWPHPNGKILYSLQEHSSMVDVLSVAKDGTTLDLLHGVKIMPDSEDPKHYWADEVRLSRPVKGAPRYMYASTRGLEATTMGWVSVFALNEDGLIQGEAIDILETATSGGIANAIEPMPQRVGDEMEYLAMTDSHSGYVFVLGFDGKKLREVARNQLMGDDGKTLAAATAVWL